MAVNILLSAIIPYRLTLRFSILLFAAGAITLILSGGISWTKGYTPARIYFFAWLVMLVRAFAFSLKTLGLLPSTALTNYAVTIGSACEVILLSLAIGDRINLERSEKQATRNRLFEVQKELLTTKNESLENAQLSDQKKQEFLATMSHELRTPFNGILGCTQLLQEADLGEEEKDTVSFLSSSSKQMLSHVNRILNFSQLHEGKLVKDEVIFDMRSLADAIAQAYLTQSKEKSLSFDVIIHDSASGIFQGDKQKLLMILSDLVENAIKFTSTGSIKIEVKSQQNIQQNIQQNTDSQKIEDFWLEFCVTDTGCGIAPENSNDIFKMFIQEDSSFKRSHEGLGLGLAICKKYVELLGGEIRFESDLGKGSKFVVTLPLTKHLSNAKEHGSDGNERLDTGHKNILIVEDNPTNQMILAKMLSKLGYKHAIAENGIEALDALKAGSFDLILMDCHMPLMDGFEATSNIRSPPSKHQQIPIIAVTANSMAGDRERCLKAGMNDYIAKPFSKSLLVSKMNFWFLNNPDNLQ